MEENLIIPNELQKVGLKDTDKVYFSKLNTGLKAFEIINLILEPYGYEGVSAGQFTRVAGGSVNSSNKVQNYAVGPGSIANGYTYYKDILGYCRRVYSNSIFVPLDDVIKEFEWAKKVVNGGYITLHSNGKTRYDVEAMMDITKGLLNEVAFRIDLANHGISIELNRDLYSGTRNTDQGQDVKSYIVDGHRLMPNIKVQIKDVQYFMLIPNAEFDGDRLAKVFVGYKVHWKKSNTGQRFFRSLGGKGEEIFSDYPALKGVRVERRGWAKREDFKDLPAGGTYRGMKFNNSNKYVYWDDLRDLETLFPEFEKLLQSDD